MHEAAYSGMERKPSAYPKFRVEILIDKVEW
jgi:hypothetical protein